MISASITCPSDKISSILKYLEYDISFLGIKPSKESIDTITPFSFSSIFFTVHLTISFLFFSLKNFNLSILALSNI